MNLIITSHIRHGWTHICSDITNKSHGPTVNQILKVAVSYEEEEVPSVLRMR